ncbi:MAG: glycosyl hydrolase family 28 protein [Verrucomicrobiota bacterium]
MKNVFKKLVLVLSVWGLFGLCLADAIEAFPETPKAFGSNRFELEIEGKPVFVQKFKDVHYAHFPLSPGQEARIEVIPRVSLKSLRVSPKAKGIEVRMSGDGKSGSFSMKAGYLVVTLNEKERLFLFGDEAQNSGALVRPEKYIDVLDLGADPEGERLSTEAIHSAIEKAKPGESVLLPAGHYLSGTIHLKSGVSLWLDPGALLQAVGDPSQFDPLMNAFIQADGVENVRIEGLGTIDGSGAYLRHLTEESGRLVYIKDSRKVSVRGLILRNPRAWNSHIVRSEEVLFQWVKVLNDRSVSNTDGINPDSSRDVRIEDSFLYCGDDNVAVKSRKWGGKFQDVHNVLIRNNVMLTKKSALKVGTESRGAEMRDVTFENNDVVECDRGMALYARDGTHMHNIRYIGNRFEAPYPDYYQRLIHFEVKKRYGLSRISDVLIKDCAAEIPWPEASLVNGFAKGFGVSGVRIENLRIGDKKVTSAEEANLEVGKHAEMPVFK